MYLYTVKKKIFLIKVALFPLFKMMQMVPDGKVK